MFSKKLSFFLWCIFGKWDILEIFHSTIYDYISCRMANDHNLTCNSDQNFQNILYTLWDLDFGPCMKCHLWKSAVDFEYLIWLKRDQNWTIDSQVLNLSMLPSWYAKYAPVKIPTKNTINSLIIITFVLFLLRLCPL